MLLLFYFYEKYNENIKQRQENKGGGYEQRTKTRRNIESTIYQFINGDGGELLSMCVYVCF